MFTTLSILVYIAEVVEKVSGAILGTGICLGTLSLISLIVMGCCAADSDIDTSDKAVKIWVKYTLMGVIFTMVCILVFAVIPTKKAVYMIAGLQAADYLIQTDSAKEIGNEGIKIFKDVGTIIHSYATEAVGTVTETVKDGAKTVVETTDKVVTTVKDSAKDVVKETIKETISTDK